MNHRPFSQFQVKELRLKTGIRYLASGSYKGEQIRKRFASREKAQDFADDYNQRLTVERQPQGSSVFTRLSQDEIQLAEVAFHRAGDLDLLAVIDAGIKAMTAGRPKLPLGDIIKRYQSAKERENLSEEGLSNIRKRLASFERDSGGKMDRAAIQQYLNRTKRDGEPLSPVTVINDRAILHGMFGWAVMEGFLSENPVATIRRPKAPPTRARVLTVEQAEKLIQVATSYKDGKRLPYFAMALYAGIRPRELHRLNPERVNLDSGTITIDAESSKTRRRHRFVTIHPVLAALLKGRDIAAALSGKNFRREFDAIRVLAGMLDEWQDDIMRHSFGSYHLAQWGDVKLTARQMGNSEEIVYQDYYDRISPADAARFWKAAAKSKRPKPRVKRRAAKAG